MHICFIVQQEAQLVAIRHSIRTDGSTAAEKHNSVQEQKMADTGEGLK
jgi:hypothetical protein